MAESISIQSSDRRFEPTEHARGPWDPRALHGGGFGVAESVLHDTHGPIGRAFQTLVVQPR
jgi:hypothetical protein